MQIFIIKHGGHYTALYKGMAITGSTKAEAIKRLRKEAKKRALK